MRTRQLATLSIALKVALVAMLLVALAIDAQQFQGKALGARLIFYPLAASSVAIVWFIARAIRGRSGPYPYRADIFVTLPFLIDTIGNWLDLFDKITWWDDLMHFSLWFLLLLGLGGVLIGNDRIAKWRQIVLIAGVGALFAVFWELGEYFFFVQDNPSERATAYQDTIGDLCLGSTGAAIAGAVQAFVFSRTAARKRNELK